MYLSPGSLLGDSSPWDNLGQKLESIVETGPVLTLPIAPRPTKPQVASRAVEVENSRAGCAEAEAVRHTAEPTIVVLIVLVAA